ncbi:MAG TPA: GNAT family N-acetyltransferase [Dongiaceae bacterium]|jgi:putative acetyltransferase|nr:GNAT family N-acetyltransferase [Dongiaceae bacterium]
MSKRLIVIEPTDPRHSEVRVLVAELDAYMHRLYPAESNHLVDVEILARPDVKFFLGRVDGESLGCGAIMLRDGESEAYAEVKRIYVAPQARGLGLGRLMLRRLEEATRAEGLSLLRLETGPRQPEALALFAAHGFARCGHFGDYPTDDPLSIFMEKRLSSK